MNLQTTAAGRVADGTNEPKIAPVPEFLGIFAPDTFAVSDFCDCIAPLAVMSCALSVEHVSEVESIRGCW